MASWRWSFNQHEALAITLHHPSHAIFNDDTSFAESGPSPEVAYAIWIWELRILVQRCLLSLLFGNRAAKGSWDMESMGLPPSLPPVPVTDLHG